MERCDCSTRLIKAVLKRLFRDSFNRYQLKCIPFWYHLITLPVLADDWPQWRNRDANLVKPAFASLADGPPLKCRQIRSVKVMPVSFANGRLHTIG